MGKVILFSLFYFSIVGMVFSSEVEVQKLYLNKEYSYCVQMCEEDIKNRGTDIFYWVKGLCQIKLGDYKGARRTFQVLLEKFADSSFEEEARLCIGDTYLYELRLDDAYKSYKEYLRESPSGDILPFLYMRLAKVCLKLGKWEEAVRYLTVIVNEYKDVPFCRQAEEILRKKEFFFTIQTGAFANKDNAYKFSQRLKAEGYPSYVKRQINSGILYKVYVGRYNTRSAVEKVKSSLDRAGYPSIILP